MNKCLSLGFFLFFGASICLCAEPPQEVCKLQRSQDAVRIIFPPEKQDRFLYGMFAYPSRYQEESGQEWPGLVAREPSQFTTRFPEIDEIDGVTLLLYWSVMEPSPGEYRWKIIDDAITYWKSKDKKVVIAVAPWALPVSFSDEWGGGIQDALPSWVPETGCKVYITDAVPVMGNPIKGQMGTIKIPLVTDERFRKSWSRFIQALGSRYDGNPDVAFVRIGVGHIGEETYPLPPFPASRHWGEETARAAERDGVSVNVWYDYCIWVTAEYQKYFSKTPLSINLILSGYLYKQSPDYLWADRLLNYCLIHGIMMGNNGLRDTTINDIEDVESCPRATYWLLKQFSDAGFPVENEMLSPPDGKEAADPARQLEAIKLVRPRYLNLFGVHPAVIAAYRNPELRASSVDWKTFCKKIKARDQDPEKIAAAYSDMVRQLQMYKIR